MALHRVAAFVTRGLQIIFGAVVLGLSIKAILWQGVGHVPSANGYSSFVGAFAALVGLIGLVVIFLTRLETPMVITDGLAAAMLFAGGVSYAVQLRGVDCKDGSKSGTTANAFINGGRGTSERVGRNLVCV